MITEFNIKGVTRSFLGEKIDKSTKNKYFQEIHRAYCRYGRQILGCINNSSTPKFMNEYTSTITMYLKCPNCGQINYDPQLTLIELAKPAPCCGANGEPREIWPSISVRMFYNAISKQDNITQDGLRINIVFLSTALEVLLEDVLWELLELHTKSLTLAEVLFESNNGREKRTKLYNSLSDKKISDLLISNDEKKFIQYWSTLARMRNLIVHGKYFSELKDAIEIVEYIKDNALDIFSKIENDVQRQKLSKGV